MLMKALRKIRTYQEQNIIINIIDLKSFSGKKKFLSPDKIKQGNKCLPLYLAGCEHPCWYNG